MFDTANKGSLKIIDFPMSTRVDRKREALKGNGSSSSYKAPEILLREKQATEQETNDVTVG